MKRFWRINTIWRKELADTLRDRRTVLAMVLVPMVLYPALMLGSLQALQVQVSYLVTEVFDVGVADEQTQVWLRTLIQRDGARQESAASSKDTKAPPAPSAAQPTVVEQPPKYRIRVLPDLEQRVLDGRLHAAVLLDGPPPTQASSGSTHVRIAFDDSNVRSQIASAGIQGVLDRTAREMLAQRLAAHHLTREFVAPLRVESANIAPAERMTGSLIGQVVPLILIIMTITGAMYPAIDLTAGERERGTLETLMAAPVRTLDLISGKLVVVAIVGMLSATLNLLSIGGTIYLGGVGSMLTPGAEFTFPLQMIPWVLLLLIPLSVLFGAMLLAVCSFARSFKEAQNYIVPVMMAAMIPGVIGILPGTRLEGPILIMPVANIVVLTRELFLGKFPAEQMLWVFLTTSLYAGAAVAVAAKLFGQEAVLFADSGSIRTLFQRKFFKPRRYPSAAQALLVVALVFSLNFYIQVAIGQNPNLRQGVHFLIAIALTVTVFFGIAPWFAARYMRVNPTSAFQLHAPDPRALLAAICFGSSTWILAARWMEIQRTFLPMDPAFEEALKQQFAWFDDLSPLMLVFFLALVPAFCEELFFRGYALSGLRPTVGRFWGVLVVAVAFGMNHHSAQRIALTTALGVLFGLLVVQYRSIFPAMIAHFMHNALTIMAGSNEGFRAMLSRIGYPTDPEAPMPTSWVAVAALVVTAGILICVFSPKRGVEPLADECVTESAACEAAP